MRVIGSLIFVAAVVLGCVGLFGSDGLVCVLRLDGSVSYCKDSTGPQAGTDEWLLTVVYLVPSAIICLVRAGKRPALVEIALFLFVLYALSIGYDSIGYYALIDTIEAAGDRWLAAGLLGVGAAILVLFLLVVEGWLIRRHP